MKAPSNPSIRIGKRLRDDIQQSLEPGETVSAMVKRAVRIEVTRRQDQSEFVRRGLASIARSEAAQDWGSAEGVIRKLETKVAAAHERQKKSSA